MIVSAFSILALLGLFMAVHIWRMVQCFVHVPRVMCSPEMPEFGRVHRFSVLSCDRVRIAGVTIHPSEYAGKGIVVLCHGWGLCKEKCFDHAKKLVEQGFIVVAFDFRNCGESARSRRLVPEPLDHGLHDLDAVLNYIRQSIAECMHGISLMGFSYGGNVILAYAGFSEMHYKVIILDSTPLTPYRHFISHSLIAMRARAGTRFFHRWLEPINIKFADYLLHGERFYQRAIASSESLIHTRLLYIVGEKELYFDPAAAFAFATRHFRGPMEFYHVPRGRHLTNYIAGGAHYWRRVLAALHGAPVAPGNA